MYNSIISKEVIGQIKAELKKNANEETKASFQRFFKEEVNCYGVKSAVVGKIAKKYWQEVKDLSKEEIFGLCEKLYQSNLCEEGFIVSNWLPHLKDKFEPEDLEIFESWVRKYISNWAACDGFCNHTVGTLLQKYPSLISKITNWAKDKNRWLKRAAAVSLIVPAKNGNFLQEAFTITDILLTDQDDMVQKGYGWLLKEASRLHQKEVFEYVIKNKKIIPRTALRCAIELMPKKLREKAMTKK